MYDTGNSYRSRVFINAIECNIWVHDIATQAGANFVSCATCEWEGGYHRQRDFQVAEEACRPRRMAFCIPFSDINEIEFCPIA
jgi:hypothetical protein